MTKIEYLVVSVPANDAATLTSRLNGYGASGWDIVAVLPLAGSDHAIYLKREKK